MTGWARLWRWTTYEYPTGRVFRRPPAVVSAIVAGAVAGSAAAVLIAWTVGPLAMGAGFGI